MLYTIPRGEADILERFRATDLDAGSPVSVMEVVLDPTNPSVLHGYLGFADEADGGNSRVHHLRVDETGVLESSLAGGGYDASSVLDHPKSFVVDQVVYGAWLDVDGSISLHSPSGSTTTFNANPGVPARAVSFVPIAGQSVPGVVFARARGGVFAELEGAGEVELEECAGAADEYLSMRSVHLVNSAAWLFGWTASSQQSWFTETKLLVCPDDMNCFAQACDPEQMVRRNVIHPAESVMRLDSNTFVWASATPTYGSDGQVALTLAVRRFDYEDPEVDAPVAELVGSEVVVSSPSTEDPTDGPGLPALALLPPDKLALSFIETDAELEAAALRIRRYHLCLPAE
jgi:hypothetical protein